ncbi:hypothetical protein AVEN_21114-1, partial [Araneus ventricosus]
HGKLEVENDINEFAKENSQELITEELTARSCGRELVKAGVDCKKFMERTDLASVHAVKCIDRTSTKYDPKILRPSMSTLETHIEEIRDLEQASHRLSVHADYCGPRQQ